MTRLQRLALINSLAVLLVVLIGGLLRLTETGGQHSFLYGATVAVASFLVLATALLTNRTADASPRSRTIAWLSLWTMAVVALNEVVAVSGWQSDVALVIRPLLAMAWLGLAFLLCWSLVSERGGASWLVGTGNTDRDAWLVWLGRLGVLILLLVIATGAITGGNSTSLPCPSWPLCVEDGVLPDQPSLAVWLQVAHRTLTAAAAIVLFAATIRAWLRPTSFAVRRLTLAISAVLIIQMLLGGNLVVAGGPAWLGLLHLVASIILWLAAIGLAVEAPRASVALSHTSPLPMGSDPASASSPPSMPLTATSRPTTTMALEAVAPLDLQLPDVRAVRAVVSDYVALTKPGIMTLLLVTTFAAMLIAASGLPPFGLICITILGGILAAGGANVLNCYIDRDIDAQMTRTRHRATASNRIPLSRVLAFGLGLSVLSVLLLGIGANWVAALLALAGNLFYVLIYTKWLKRRTPQNIVIGGAAGAVPPLVGWAAVTGSLSPTALMLFAIIFMWTPPHFWALALLKQGEYGRAAVPMLPVVAGEAATRRQIVIYSALLFLVCLALVPLGLGPIYLVGAISANAVFLGLALLLHWRPAKRHARQLFFWSLWYLALIFLAAVADRLILG